MIRDKQYKLIYYPCGNVKQLFDMDNDPYETHDLSKDSCHKEVLKSLEEKLVREFYGPDLDWIRDGKLVGFASPETFVNKPDFGLYNQRGYHWPQPKGYSNKGKDA